MSRHHDRIKNTREWKEARAFVLDRDDNSCVRCGSEDRLEVDHIIELSLAPELATEVENLQTLCDDCHIEKGRSNETELPRVDWVSAAYADVIGDLVFLTRT